MITLAHRFALLAGIMIPVPLNQVSVTIFHCPVVLMIFMIIWLGTWYRGGKFYTRYFYWFHESKRSSNVRLGQNINLSHSCHILLWFCVWGGCTIIFCQLFNTYISRESWVVVSIITVQSTMCANPRHITAARSFSFVCTLQYIIIITM